MSPSLSGAVADCPSATNALKIGKMRKWLRISVSHRCGGSALAQALFNFRARGLFLTFREAHDDDQQRDGRYACAKYEQRLSPWHAPFEQKPGKDRPHIAAGPDDPCDGAQCPFVHERDQRIR